MTAHSELVAAVAAIIARNVDGRCSRALLMCADNTADPCVCRSEARAALALIGERMREPSREMIRAAPTGYPTTIWEAMLDASPLYPPAQK